MKQLTFAIFAFATFTTTMEAQKKDVNITESQVVWKGYKVAGSHTGTISIQAGTLEFNNNELVGGTFIMDMTTIGSTDLSGEYKEKLDGHLKSDDFFGVATYPTAHTISQAWVLLQRN